MVRLIIKVLITGAYCSLNNGELAMIQTTMKLLKENIEDIKFSVFPNYPNYSPDRYHAKIIGITPQPSKIGLNYSTFNYLYDIFKLLLYFLFWKTSKNQMLLNNPILRTYHDADFILDISGDGISDDYGFFATLLHCYTLFLALLLQKPYIIFAQSIGPFNNLITLRVAKFILNRAQLITVRDPITLNYLKNILTKSSKIVQTTDIAFLLKPNKRIKEKHLDCTHPLVGVSINGIISRWAFPNVKNHADKYANYTNVMARMCDYLIEKYNARLIFIPHVFGPLNADDRIVMRAVYQKMKHMDKVELIEQIYSPSEIKDRIGQCDLFIGARMHALIAAISMEIPLIAISYSHKYKGVIGELFNMQDFIIDVRDHDPESLYTDLVEKIDILVNKHVAISLNLKETIPIVELNSKKNIELLMEYIIAEGFA